MNQETEIWKSVAGYEEMYEVSNLGRVRRIFFAKHHPTPPQIIGGCPDQDGYIRVAVRKRGETRYVPIGVHRLVAAAFVENPKPDVFNDVNHDDGVKANNVFSNLEWTDVPGNQKHASRNGLMASGERVSRAKLTEEQVIWIVSNPNRLTYEQLAAACGVTKSAVNHIKNGRTWNTGWSFKRNPDPLASR